MRRIIAVIIALLLLAAVPASTFAQGKHKKKKLHFWQFTKKKRERMKKWNTGHTAFKNRTKRDQKLISRHHLTPDYVEKHKGKHKNHKGKSEESSGKDKEQETADNAGKDTKDKDMPKDDAPKDTPPPSEAPKDTPAPPSEAPKDTPPPAGEPPKISSGLK